MLPCPWQEPDTYRLALTRMADDILSLRRHVVNLETENSNLRRNLNMHKDLGRTLLDDVDIDVMTKAEIVDRIGEAPQLPPPPLGVAEGGGNCQEEGVGSACLPTDRKQRVGSLG